MTETTDLIGVLAVDDDPATLNEIEELLADSRLVFHFADTTNAFSRVMESQSIDVAVIHVHAGSDTLLEPLARQLRMLNPPIALIALVDPEPASALTASRVGVHGCARIDDPRGAARIIEDRVSLIRRLRTQAEALDQVSDIHDRYNLLLESSREAIAYLHEGLHIYANPSYLKQFGYTKFDDLEGYSILDLVSSTGDGLDLKQLLKALSRRDLPSEPIEVLASREDGSQFRAMADFSPARYDGEVCTQITVRERAEDDKELAAELEKMRSHDLLTGLLNRQAFIGHLQQELQAPPENRHMAVLLVTLDDHTGLQRKIGAAATDLLITQAAAILVEVADPQMLPARLSDYVLALRIWFQERKEAESLATALVENFSGRILEVRDKTPTVTASVGLAVGGSQQFNADELLAQAESALQEAARTGGNSYVRYRPKADATDSGDQEQWTEKLRHALNNQEFRLVRLPITSMEDDEFLINEFETRLRVEGNDEIILPAVFRPAAARAGLAVDLDRDLVQHLIAGHNGKGHEGKDFLVPLSAQCLGDDEFIAWLQQLIDEDQLAGPKMILGFQEAEVRESLREMQRLISRFGARGVRFALLEVETGAKIDLLLKNIRVDFIKLGGNITSALRNDSAARAALEALAATAAEHGIQVIAPQVENTSDLAALWQFGITLVQDDFGRDEDD
ncbi:MAG: EAL domain-containing protein [Wenzhouxiangellaceae bacterium]|nr:EAL domain-containing protein [Wenzhouxiangellaceae bacterium]